MSKNDTVINPIIALRDFDKKELIKLRDYDWDTKYREGWDPYLVTIYDSLKTNVQNLKSILFIFEFIKPEIIVKLVGEWISNYDNIKEWNGSTYIPLSEEKKINLLESVIYREKRIVETLHDVTPLSSDIIQYISKFDNSFNQAFRSFRGKNSKTILSYLFYMGRKNSKYITRWFWHFLEIGCDPTIKDRCNISPFMQLVYGLSYNDLVLYCLQRYSININNITILSMNLLLYIVEDNKFVKSEERLQSLLETVNILVEYKIDLEFTDHYGRNISDLVSAYNFTDYFKHISLPKPTGNKHEEEWWGGKQDPIVIWLHKHRYDRKVIIDDELRSYRHLYKDYWVKFSLVTWGYYDTEIPRFLGLT